MTDNRDEERADCRRAVLKRLAAVAVAGGVAGLGAKAMAGEPPRLIGPGKVIRKPPIRRLEHPLPTSQAKMATLKGPNRALAQTFNQAMRTLDMRAAIEAKGRGLAPLDRALLQKMTREDLVHLRTILTKLGPALNRANEVSASNGWIIY